MIICKHCYRIHNDGETVSSEVDSCSNCNWQVDRRRYTNFYGFRRNVVSCNCGSLFDILDLPYWRECNELADRRKSVDKFCERCDRGISQSCKNTDSGINFFISNSEFSDIKHSLCVNCYFETLSLIEVQKKELAFPSPNTSWLKRQLRVLDVSPLQRVQEKTLLPYEAFAGMYIPRILQLIADEKGVYRISLLRVMKALMSFMQAVTFANYECYSRMKAELTNEVTNAEKNPATQFFYDKVKNDFIRQAP